MKINGADKNMAKQLLGKVVRPPKKMVFVDKDGNVWAQDFGRKKKK